MRASYACEGGMPAGLKYFARRGLRDWLDVAQQEFKVESG
jgi:hypothetical protein